MPIQYIVPIELMQSLETLAEGLLFDITYESAYVNVYGFIIIRELDYMDPSLDTDIYSICFGYTELLFTYNVVNGINVLKNNMPMDILIHLINVLKGKYTYVYKKETDICMVNIHKFNNLCIIDINADANQCNADANQCNDNIDDLKNNLEPQIKTIEITYGELCNQLFQEGATHSCIICMDDIEKDKAIVMCPCIHIYHMDCVLKWWTTTSQYIHKCPICKH